MIKPAYIAELASYNRWQNERLFEVCATLGEDVVTEDRDLFFGSILATLQHVFTIDALLLRYLVDGVPPGEVAVPADFASLRSARFDLDAQLAALADVDDAWLDERLDFWGGRRVPRALLVVQLFNHQTHHRSQVTTHLHLLRVDYGVTDLPFSPMSTVVTRA